MNDVPCGKKKPKNPVFFLSQINDFCDSFLNILIFAQNFAYFLLFLSTQTKKIERSQYGD